MDKELHWQTQLFLKAKTKKELSTSLISSNNSVEEAVKNPEYFQFAIPKKTGGFRTIQAPEKTLKKIQKRLSFVLNDLYIPNENAHGFIKKTSQISYHTLSNAMAHIGKNYVWNIDITDFFSSISTATVAAIFMQPPFNFVELKAKYIALLIGYKRQLPTGSPCSPIVSNLVCDNLDKKMQTLVNDLNKTDENLNLVFTRYADDITFSSQVQLNSFQKQAVYQILAEFGFTVNEKKNREHHKLQSQWVTGIKVNEKPNLDRKYIRNIRAILHQIRMYGLEQSTAKYFGLSGKISSSDMQKFINSIQGKIQHIGFVKGREDANYLKFSKEMNVYVNVIFSYLTR